MRRVVAALILCVAAGCSRGPTLQDLAAATVVADSERARLERYEAAHKVIVKNVAEGLVAPSTSAEKKAEYQRIEKQSEDDVAAQRAKWEKAAALVSEIEKGLK